VANPVNITATERRVAEEEANESVKAVLLISGADKQIREAQGRAGQQLPVGNRSVSRHVRQGRLHPKQLPDDEV